MNSEVQALWFMLPHGIDAYANAYQTDEPRRMMQAFLDSKARDR